MTETAQQGVSGFLSGLDRLVVKASEWISAVFVVAEILLLLVGVISRYVFDSPIIWVNELAEMLFLWLVSLGAVIALNKGEHMRMTIVLNRMSQRMRRFAERASGLIVAVVSLVLLVPGISYMWAQAAITTPMLHISGAVEVAGQLIVLAMLFYVALRQFFAGTTWRELLVLAGLGLVLLLGFWQAEDLLYDIGNWTLIIFFVLIVGLCIVGGVPIAFAFGIATISYINFTSTTPLSIVISQMDQGMASLELLAVPMFIILGMLLELSGIARALIDMLTGLVGRRL